MSEHLKIRSGRCTFVENSALPCFPILDSRGHGHGPAQESACHSGEVNSTYGDWDIDDSVPVHLICLMDDLAEEGIESFVA